MRRKAFAAACLLLGVPALLAAEVELRVGPGGRKVISNEGSPQARRGATRQAAVRVRRPDPELETLIDRHCDAHALDARLVRALIQVESAWDRTAVSRAGAMGLMQLMPDTAALMRVADPYDPAENVRAGTAFLRRMIDRFGGRLELALAAYNAGPEAVERHGGIPPYAETRDYVRRILGRYDGPDQLPVLSPTAGTRRTRFVRPPGSRPLLTTALAPR
jgi:soluble lytic murein transglycosylase-like protein